MRGKEQFLLYIVFPAVPERTCSLAGPLRCLVRWSEKVIQVEKHWQTCHQIQSMVLYLGEPITEAFCPCRKNTRLQTLEDWSLFTKIPFILKKGCDPACWCSHHYYSKLVSPNAFFKASNRNITIWPLLFLLHNCCQIQILTRWCMLILNEDITSLPMRMAFFSHWLIKHVLYLK